MTTTAYPSLTALQAVAGTSGFLKKNGVDGFVVDTSTYLLSTANAVSATKISTQTPFSITGGATAAAINFDGTQASIALNVTALDASKLTGTIPSAILGNSTFYLGTTAIKLNSTSGQNAVVTGLTSVAIGSAVLKYDTTNNALYVEKADGSAVNFYSTGESAAYGVGSGLPSGGGGGGVSAMSLLTDVSLITPANGNVLIFNGTHWENKPQSILVPDLSNYALKGYVDIKVANLIATAPEALDTLNELALALGNDPNFATTITTLVGTKESAIAAGSTSQYWSGNKTWQTFNTTNIAEGTKLFFTDARVKAYGDTVYALKTATATKLATARTIWGQSFDGSAAISGALSGATTIVASSTITATGGFIGALTGNASTATTLATARTIGGVSFNGSANIDLPGVNTAGNQSTSGNAGTATKLANPRAFSIGGTTGLTATAVNFDGTANIALALTGTLATANGGTGFTDAKNGIARIVTGTLTTSATTYAITHSLNNDVVAQMINVATKEVVEVDIVQTSATVVTFGFNVAPAANAYRYVIVG